MKKILLFLAIILLFTAACTAPADDAPRASVGDKPAPVEDDTEPEEGEGEPPGDMGTEQDEEVEEDADSEDSDDSSEADAEVEAHEEDDFDPAELGDNEPTAGPTPIDLEKSSFSFIGYGPGKSHDGTFDEMEGYLTIEDGKIVAAEGTIQAASVNTGIGGLDDHLLADDFFDAEKFPTIVMKSTTIGEGEVTGELTFHGVTETITFPATIAEDGISAEFVLDTTPFGMTNAGVNKEVTISFDLWI